MILDRANGYERVAAEFMAARSDSGKAVVEKWVASLPQNASVLDIGAGHGQPLSTVITQAGCQLSAIDASTSLVAAFRKNFPNVRVRCETAEDSDFFDETFDAVLSVGLMFLLPEKTQETLIRRIADSLKPNGHFLFSSPEQDCEWVDILTEQKSFGLGADAYEAILNRYNLKLIATHTDSGGSHYYDAIKRDV